MTKRRVRATALITAFGLTLGMLGLSGVISGCSTQAQITQQNMRREADNFNIMRRFIAINPRTDTVMLEIIGYISLTVDSDGDARVLVRNADGSTNMHFVALNHLTYVLEDLSGAQVSSYHVGINFMPRSIIPFYLDVN
jgi:hypothetical protein